MKEWSLTKPATVPAVRRGAQGVARLGVLLALALLLQAVEGMLPPLGLPGVNLGLANTVVLLALELWGLRPAFILMVCRQILGGILTGKLLSVGFYLGLAGGLASIFLMYVWQGRSKNRGDLLTTSILGAIAHNWGQLLAARFIINHEAVVWYLPLLTLAAVPCGAVVAGLCRPLLKFFSERKIPFFRPDWKAAFLLVCIAGLSVGLPFAVSGAGAEPDRAEITVGGEAVKTLSLEEDGLWRVDGRGHTYTLEVKGGQIRVLVADCPDQVCVRTGFISRPGQSIVCVPGQLVITLTGSAGGELDGILP